jgi:hypothetical protein
MANKNGTGPSGEGPKTGRQMGNCKGAQPTQGRGQARGFGMQGRQGRGFGKNFCWRDLNEEEMKQLLELRKKATEKEINKQK